MGTRWERKNPLLDVNKDLLSELLLPYLKGQKLKTLEYLSGGYCNTNLQITLEESTTPLVVRIGKKDSRTLQKEWNLNLFLKENASIPVPEFLYFGKGSENEWGHDFLVMEWIEGQHLQNVLSACSEEEAMQIGEELGKTMASFHSIPVGTCGLLDENLRCAQLFSSYSSSWMEASLRCLQDKASERIDPDDQKVLLSLLKENISLLESCDSYLCLVHADCNGSNVLLRKREDIWEIATFLDWEFAWHASPVFDLGQFLRFEKEFPPSFAFNLLATYQKESKQEFLQLKEMAKLSDILNLLFFLNDPVEKPILFDTMRSLLSSTLDFLKREAQ